MEYAFNLNGATVETILEFPVDKNRVVKRGQILSLLNGRIADASFTKVLGIAAEDHSGVEDMLNPRSNGAALRVSCGSTAVFAADAPVITAASGTDTKIVGDLGVNLADDSLKGGYLVLVSLGNGSTNTDSLGAVREITAHTSANQTFTVTPGGAACAGDVYAVLPQAGFEKLTLNAADKTKPGFLNTGAMFAVVGSDVKSLKYYVTPKTKVFA